MQARWITTDPAVRAVRVATALNERFGAILREAATELHAPQVELLIGEAQQIYPEIWRYLDEARATLAAREREVVAYDTLRATERPGAQAVDDIERAEAINPLMLAFGTLQHVELKTATFNAEGHRKARAACTMLMDAMPEVDWRGLERAEDAEIAAAGSLVAGRWKHLAVIGVIVLITVVVLSRLA